MRMIKITRAALRHMAQTRGDEFEKMVLSAATPDGDRLLVPGEAWVASKNKSVTPGLGDRIERLVKPIAKALKLDCLDENERLKPESPCAKRRDWLNRHTRKT